MTIVMLNKVGVGISCLWYFAVLESPILIRDYQKEITKRKLQTALITAQLVALSFTQSPGLYNASDIAQYLANTESSPAGEGGDLVSQLRPRALGPDKGDEDSRCFMIADSDDQCRSGAGRTTSFSKLKGDHQCIDTRGRHSLQYSDGCAEGEIFHVEAENCAHTGVIYVSVVDLRGCIHVNLQGHNWQSALRRQS